MSIDDRIQALVEPVELLTADVHGLQNSHAKLLEAQTKLTESQAKTQIMLAQVAENIGVLTRVAGIHQDRIDGHEQRLTQLEN